MHQLRQIADIPVHADIVVSAAEPGRVDTEALGILAPAFVCRNALQAKQTASTARALPSTQEASADAGALVRSIYSLVYVLATSAAFRLILSDVFLIVRETTADVAARVGLAAAVVEKVAEDVEGTVRPGGGTVADVKAELGGFGDGIANELSGDGIVADGMREIAAKVQQESPDAAKDAVIRRLQEVGIHHVFVRRQAGTDCFVGYGAGAPESVLPGRLPHHSRAVPQICSESAHGGDGGRHR